MTSASMIRAEIDAAIVDSVGPYPLTMRCRGDHADARRAESGSPIDSTINGCTASGSTVARTVGVTIRCVTSAAISRFVSSSPRRRSRESESAFHTCSREKDLDHRRVEGRRRQLQDSGATIELGDLGVAVQTFMIPRCETSTPLGLPVEPDV